MGIIANFAVSMEATTLGIAEFATPYAVASTAIFVAWTWLENHFLFWDDVVGADCSSLSAG